MQMDQEIVLSRRSMRVESLHSRAERQRENIDSFEKKNNSGRTRPL